MKAKNLLKKLISTILCVSTLNCTVGVLSYADTPIKSDNQFIQIYNATSNIWNLPQLCTLEILNQLANDIPYKICDSTLSRCIGHNIPSQPESLLSTLGNYLLVPLGIVGTIAKNFFPLMQTVMFGGAIYMMAKNFIKETFGSWFNNNCGKIEKVVDPLEAIERFDKYTESIKGQDEVKIKVRQLLVSSIDEANQRAKGESNKKGVNIFYFIGSSGTGKTSVGESSSKVMYGENSVAYIVDPSHIDPSSKKASVSEQLFGMRTRKVGANEIYEKSPLVSQIQATPAMLLLINEYDKMCTKELDEKLRTIADNGYFTVNGEKIDCSRLTIIITSNEDLGSVTKTEHKDDGTGSRTQVEHDKAFLNRLKIVEFNNLSAKDYIEIEKPLFERLQQRYLNDYNVFVTFEDGLLEKVAKLVEQKNQGARPIQDFIDIINDKLLIDVILKSAKNKSYIGKAVSVSLNEDETNSSFVLTETTDYKKVLEILVTKLKNLYSNNHNVKLEISDETISNLVKFLKENNGSAETAAAIVNSLNKKIFDNIIAKDKKKKSYMGKSFKLDLNNTGWEINEIIPSEENKSANTTPSQDSEDKEIAPELSEIDKQKAEIKTLEDSKADTALGKETTETSIEAAAAA